MNIYDEIEIYKTRHGYYDEDKSLRIENQITLNGSIDCYNEMCNTYSKALYPQELLFYSIVMALKYDYPPAYYDVYHAMTSIYDEHPSLGKMDSKTQEEAFFFLKEGAVKGDEKCIKELDRLKQSKCKSY